MAYETDVFVLPTVTIIYCGKCGMPPEFCEYGPDFESHCDPWLKKRHPDLHATLKTKRGDTSVGGEEAATTAEGGAAAGGPTKPARPAEPWTNEERLMAFYEQYQPDKVSDVPSLLEKYAGKEDKLFLALTKKYGPEPDDPYDEDSEEESDSDDDDDDDDGGDNALAAGMDNLAVVGSGGKKRRGVKAKKSQKVETRVLIYKEKRQRKKAITIVYGMATVPGIKLKDVSKAFSKKFAGSSSVKDDAKGDKQIIIQGDHMEETAELLVSKFKVPGTCIFLDFEGNLVAFE